MSGIYEFLHTVAVEEIDGLGHANNVAYVAWMQSAAVAHSAALGWPGDRYRQLGAGWVVRSHTIQYHLPAVAGDEILVRTWVATMTKVTSVRCFQIFRKADEKLLATAETKWAFVDYATRQPRRIPPEITEAFPVVQR